MIAGCIEREATGTVTRSESNAAGKRPRDLVRDTPDVDVVDGDDAVTRRLSLLLVDDHAILREGLRALLELGNDLTVVGEASTFEQGMELAERLQPDIVLSDIGLPGRSGLLLVRELRKACPQTRVILLTAHGTEEYIRAGLDAQADGYVLKDSGHAELLTAIRTVATGQQYLCKAVASLVLATYLHGGERQSMKDPLRGITGRERQVLTRIACGHSNKNVARDLNLSVKTIEKHRANLMRKLSLHNAADITRFALNNHLVAAEDPSMSSAPDLPARTGS
jgi:DNA-binding NarL/FixJ family response regulator